jgi:hypothetical protein
MSDIWMAAHWGDLAEVERLVGQDAGLLDARGGPFRQTLLMYASCMGHVGVVRWLLDQGAATDERDEYEEGTALIFACSAGRLPVVRLLVVMMMRMRMMMMVMVMVVVMMRMTRMGMRMRDDDDDYTHDDGDDDCR